MRILKERKILVYRDFCNDDYGSIFYNFFKLEKKMFFFDECVVLYVGITEYYLVLKKWVELWYNMDGFLIRYKG